MASLVHRPPSPDSAAEVRILGHRGARLAAPENTIPAFRAALTEGADGVELDVRATADAALVCLHDGGLGRTTNGSGPVRDQRLAVVRGLDAGACFARAGGYPFRGRGVRVPTLVEALDAVPPPALVDIEVKVRGEGPQGPQQVAERLAAVLDGRADHDRLLVSSFSRRVAAAAAQALPAVRVGLVSSGLVPLGRALRAAQAAGCSVLVAQAPAYFGPKARAAAARALADGVELAAWTVDDPVTVWRLAELGVHIVVSDQPGRLRRLLRGG